jgi:hypothetical protein
MSAVLELVHNRATESTQAKADRLSKHLNTIRKVAEEEATRRELAEQMLMAMTGAVSKVQGHVDGRLVHLSAPHAFHDAIEHLSAIAALQQVLAESACPIVRKLRLAMAHGYAQMHAAQIAQARLQCK